MIYESPVGISIEITNFFMVSNGVVFTGRITKLPNDQQEFLTHDFANLMKGQPFFHNRPIAGTEWFATSYQRIGSNVGLFVQEDQ